MSYLARYTHRVAIANSRLITFDGRRVSFKWKDYRRQGRDRYGCMTLGVEEFIRRFLLHVLPDGFHRIRHYGLFANGAREANLAQACALLEAPTPEAPVQDQPGNDAPAPCPHCGGRLVLIETWARGSKPFACAAFVRGFDTS